MIVVKQGTVRRARRCGRTTARYKVSSGGATNETRQFTYNKVDKLLTASDVTGVTTNTYDALYRLLSEERATTNQNSYTVENGYDANGNRTLVTYPVTGRVLLSEYDALNRLWAVDDVPSAGTTNVTVYGYDQNSNRIALALPNGQTTTNQFDALNRVTNMVNQVNGTNVYSVAYEYDLIGNRLTTIEDLATQGVRTNSYAYDAQYRLTQENYQLGTNSMAKGYTFDLAGNRLSMTNVVDDTTNVTSYAYDKLNRLLSATAASTVVDYGYDLNGSRTNKVEMTASATNTAAYAYDTLNRLTNATINATNSLLSKIN